MSSSIPIIVNHSDIPINRRIIIRNPTTLPYVVKVVLPKKVIEVDVSRFIVQPNTFAIVELIVHTDELSYFQSDTNKINIYARPFSTTAYNSLREWVANEGIENIKEKVKTIMVKLSKEYSSRDSIIDLPGDAQTIESIQYATPISKDDQLDRDTTTAIRFDADTVTASGIDESEKKMIEDMGNESGWKNPLTGWLPRF